MVNKILKQSHNDTKAVNINIININRGVQLL